MHRDAIYQIYHWQKILHTFINYQNRIITGWWFQPLWKKSSQPTKHFFILRKKGLKTPSKWFIIFLANLCESDPAPCPWCHVGAQLFRLPKLHGGLGHLALSGSGHHCQDLGLLWRTRLSAIKIRWKPWWFEGWWLTASESRLRMLSLMMVTSRVWNQNISEMRIGL